MRVKPVGAGHSFSGIAVAPDVLLELDDLSGVVEVDRERKRVRLLAGTRLHQIPRLLAPLRPRDAEPRRHRPPVDLGRHLDRHARHGRAVRRHRDPGRRRDARHGIRRSPHGRRDAEHRAPARGRARPRRPRRPRRRHAAVRAGVRPARRRASRAARRRARRRSTSAPRAVDHFEFYWFPHTDIALTKTNTRLPGDAPRHPLPPRRPVDRRRARRQRPPSAGLRVGRRRARGIVPPVSRSRRRAVRAIASSRMPRPASSRRTATVRFREMEYALPAENVRPAFEAMRALIDERGWRISFPVEVRFAAADDLWMSTAYGRASGYIAVHRYWREDPTEYFEAVEQIMLSFGGRPHWGKMHTLDASILRDRYPKFDDFVALRDRLDPDRRVPERLPRARSRRLAPESRLRGPGETALRMVRIVAYVGVADPCHHRRRACPRRRHLPVGDVQLARAAECARRRGVERHHGAAQAPSRPAAEPHRDGQGLRRA